MKILILFLFITASMVFTLFAETFPLPVGEFNPRTYTAFKPIDSIIIDGKLDEKSWQKALFTEPFVDIEGDLKPIPYLETKVKILWDNEFLYLGAVIKEPHIWANLRERDAVIFLDNNFEIFIDPDGTTHDYFELEINALGTLWDLYLVKPYRDRRHVAMNAWDIRKIEYAIQINGTLNVPSDEDEEWVIEMKLPISIFTELSFKEVPPPEGDFWRLNFSRVQWETEIKGDKYVKVEGVPENNWVWSPQGLINMHYPERWGYLFFSHNPVGSGFKPYTIPETEYAREYMRQLYYKQRQFWIDNGRFATDLQELSAKPFQWKGEDVSITIETTSQTFVITLHGQRDLPELYLREDGLLYDKQSRRF